MPYRKLISRISLADISAIRLGVINVILVLMIILSIATTIIPSIKVFVSSIQQPILWLTAAVVLAELVNVRASVAKISPQAVGYKPISSSMYYDWIDYDLISVFLSDYSIEVIDYLSDLQHSSGARMEVHLSVQSREFPRLDDFKYRKDFSFFVVNFMSSSSFMLAEQKDGSAKSALIELHDKEKPSLIIIDDKDDHSTTLIRGLAKSLKSEISLNLYTLPVFQSFSRKTHDYGRSLVSEKKLKLISSDFFSLLTELVAKSKNRLEAVDFIPPSQWVKNNVIRRYGESHRSATGLKQRVHVFEMKSLGNNGFRKEDYQRYISIMHSANVELRFTDLLDLDKTRYETRGSVIIDSQILGIAINAVDGAPFGEINFSAEAISEYSNRFLDLFENAMSPEDFISLFQQ